jgi:citrate synthase
MNLTELLGFDKNNLEAESLLDLLFKAHQTAAKENENASSHIAKVQGQLQTPFPAAMAAAVLTLGGLHGPITQARLVNFAWTDEQIKSYLQSGQRLPGWGNQFHKDGVDPAFKDLDTFLRENHAKYMARLDEIAVVLKDAKDKTLYPNPAVYTAIVADILGLAYNAEPLLLILPRMPIWGGQYLRSMR